MQEGKFHGGTLSHFVDFHQEERTDGRNSLRKFHEILWAVRSSRGVGEIRRCIPKRFEAQEGQSH
jgi:hypothetical protein